MFLGIAALGTLPSIVAAGNISVTSAHVFTDSAVKDVDEILGIAVAVAVLGTFSGISIQEFKSSTLWIGTTSTCLSSSAQGDIITFCTASKCFFDCAAFMRNH